ncbi:MAG: peptidase S8/S53 domain-containing protein [Linnemannia gamsii]|nr:MAG: peptidase S8/S53 domain-containing protein [Linnemannia gamsii]
MIRNEYGIFNGVAITVKSSHAGVSLAAVPGVKNVWPVQLFFHPIHPARSNGNLTHSANMNAHHMTDVGAHPAFAAPGVSEGCFARYGKNCRVKHGWDFVGDNYHTEGTLVPDRDPMDRMGYGTHPLFPWVGVAPEVTFGTYRIFACEGRTGTDSILAAMELAFNDGMDIINLSFHGSPAYNSNPMTVLDEKLIAHGMGIVACAGNDGGDEVWMVADVALGDSATSVASFDNAFYILMSSYGVDGDLRSKPDIGAPGGKIYSTSPRAKGSYTLQSGTFMSTPYYQGAGLTNVWNASTTSAHDAPDHIDLLDSVNLHKTQKVAIKNISKKTETFTLSHVPADALNSYSKGNTFPHPIPIVEVDYATVVLSANKFPLYSGFVVATPSTEGSPSVHVPYIGFKGDAHQVPIIDTDLGFPILTVTQANGTMIDVPHKDFNFNFKTAAPTAIVHHGSHTLTAPSVSTALPPNSSLDTFTPPGGMRRTVRRVVTKIRTRTGFLMLVIMTGVYRSLRLPNRLLLFS